MQYISANLQMLFLVQSTFLLLILILGIGIWRRHHCRLDQLKRQQDITEKTVRRFMEESEKTFAEVCRLMTANSLDSEKNRGHDCEPDGLNSGMDASFRNISTPQNLERLASTRERDKKAQVLSMSERGISASEIASRLNIPRGEIELIINLKNNASFRESRN
jgi:hypothetical protein